MSLEDATDPSPDVAGQSMNTGEGDAAREAPQVPTLTDQDLENNVLVGVCGVSQSGKTVFLASIFHSVNGTLVEGVGRVTLDRKDKGGERYFRNIEETIRKLGRSQGTRESAVARLLVESEGLHDAVRSPQGLILFDFAGGHFTDFADIEAAIRAADTERTKNELRLVETYLERCDALVLLIDSSQFRQTGRPSDSDPFSPSVVYLRDFCAKTRKPIALVFTKSDLNPELTIEKVQEFPRVREFMSRFESDRSHKDRPFGVVALLRCYEIDESFGRVRQNEDGSIWLPEARQIFTQILEVTWPIATNRLRDSVQRSKAREEEEEAEERRVRWRKRLKWAAVALLLLLLAAVPLVWYQFRKYDQLITDAETVTEAATALSQGLPQLVGADFPEAFRRVQSLRGDPTADKALRGFESAYRASLAEVPASVYSGEYQREATESLLQLTTLASPPNGGVIALLKLHNKILAALGTPEPSLEGLLVLIGQIAPAPLDANGAFLDAIQKEAEELRTMAAERVVLDGYNEPTLEACLTYVRKRLAKDAEDSIDAQWRAALERSYARLIGSALAGVDQRPKMIAFLKAANPDFEPLVTGANLVELVRYKFIHDTIGKAEAADLRGFLDRVKPILPDVTGRDNRTSLNIADTLQRLFRIEAGVGNRASLWRSLFSGIDSEYLFSLQRDAWPSGKGPWRTSLHGALIAADYSFEATRVVIDQLSERPLYWWEVGALLTEVQNRYLGLEAVRHYDLARQRIGEGGGYA